MPAAPDAVIKLVRRFERDREQYKNPNYNETQVRRELIDATSASEQSPKRKRGVRSAAEAVAETEAARAAGPGAHASGSDRRLDLHKQLAAAKTPTDKTAIRRQIDATDRVGTTGALLHTSNCRQ